MRKVPQESSKEENRARRKRSVKTTRASTCTVSGGGAESRNGAGVIWSTPSPRQKERN